MPISRKSSALRAGISLVLCLLLVLALRLLARSFAPSSDPRPLEMLLTVVQTLTILLFTLIIGLYVHHYPEPFFIFWFFGWASWLGLYFCRLVHFRAEHFFNPLNSVLFGLAGVLLLMPKEWASQLGRYPMAPTRHFASPLLWLARYFRNNPLALLAACPVVVLFLLQPAHPDVHRICQGIVAVTSIALLGFGLYRRTEAISRDTAFATLLLHGLYMAPQLGRMFWPETAERSFQYMYMVGVPGLVMKPALALFVTVLAFRETLHDKDEAEAMRRSMLEHLPDGCLFVRDGIVTHATERARAVLGISGGEQSTLRELFAATNYYEQFIADLRANGRTLGYDTEIFVGQAGSRFRTSRWLRVDAFLASPPGAHNEDIVLLVMDRHELELAHAVYAWVHDYMQPKIIELRGALSQRAAEAKGSGPNCGGAPFVKELKICSELIKTVDDLKEEFREYWRLRDGKDEGAELSKCLTIAWEQAIHGCADLKCDPTLQLGGAALRGIRVRSLGERALTRVLQNLLTNAIQHTYYRQQRREISAVDVEVQCSDGSAFVRIHDHGSGFHDGVIRFMNTREGVGSARVGGGLISVKLTIARAGGEVRVGNLEGKAGGWVSIAVPAHIASPADGEEG